MKHGEGPSGSPEHGEGPSGSPEHGETIPLEKRPAIATGPRHFVAGGVKRGIGMVDFLVRLLALGAALAASITMGTSDQTLPFFTQFFQFQAQFDDIPTFTFFVVANSIVCGYLVLSLPFSIVSIVRAHAAGPRLFLLIFDTIMVALTTAAASASAAIVYLAHNGNSSANWIEICQQFDEFCQRSSGATVASFVAAVFFIFLVLLSAVSLRAH